MLRYPNFDNDNPPECTRHPELFFPEKDHPLSLATQRAKSICSRCPHKKQCADWATTNKEAGIWGGTTEQERRDTRRRTSERRFMSRYALYRTTQYMMTAEGLTIREAAERLGLTYSHVSETRRKVTLEIERGHWRP